MTQNQNKPKSWYKRKEVWGGAGLVILNAAASPIVATVNPWIPFSANVILGLLTVTGLIQGAQAHNLKLTKENYKIN